LVLEAKKSPVHMPEVVAQASGPQGRASNSWDILAQNPSPPELGEPSQTKEAPEEPKEPQEEGSATEQQHEELQAEAKEGEATETEQQQQSDGQEQQSRERGTGKKESRYERTKRQRKAFEAEREKFEAERKQFAEQQRALAEAQRKASEPPYTLKELKGYRKQWEKDGNFDLVEKADAEIQRLEELEASQKQVLEIPTAGTPEFTKQWESAEQELFNVDPEFQREGTRLDKVLRAMMSGPDGQLYRQHPRGIVAAYHRARLAIAESDLGTARGEIAKLKNEVTRLNGLLGIGGGASGGRSIGEFRGKDFAALSTKEMREHLKRSATGNGHW
jgi:hypothetical protein